MNAAEILAEVSANGCRACVDGELIRLSGPRPLPRAVVNRIREHKAELLKVLSGPERATFGDPPPLTADDCGDVDEANQERAAVQEYDGGLPRPEAERQARAAKRLYAYRLNDDPGQWLVAIMPGCDMGEATHAIRNRFGAERVLEVRRHGGTP